MDTYKINISDNAKESIEKLQNLSLTINNSIYTESVAKMGNMLSNFTKAMLNNLPDINLINESLQHSIGSIAKIMSSYNYALALEGMTQTVKELSKSLSKLQTEQLSTLSKINFNKINCDFHRKEFDDLVDLAYKVTINDAVADTDISKNELKESFVELQHRNTHWKDFNIWLHDNVDKYIREHYIFCIIMSFLLAHIYFPWFDEAIGKHVIPKATSLVKELPEKGAEIICHLEQNIEAIITENQNYYYKVSFIDENGIEREGYVAKRNLKIIDQEETSDEQSTVFGNDLTSLNKE